MYNKPKLKEDTMLPLKHGIMELKKELLHDH